MPRLHFAGAVCKAIGVRFGPFDYFLRNVVRPDLSPEPISGRRMFSDEDVKKIRDAITTWYATRTGRGTGRRAPAKVAAA